MSSRAAAIDHLLEALYEAALALVAAVSDPAAIEAAPLNQRAAALNAVSHMIGLLQVETPAEPAAPAEHFDGVEFYYPDDYDDAIYENHPKRLAYFEAACAEESTHPYKPMFEELLAREREFAVLLQNRRPAASNPAAQPSEPAPHPAYAAS